MQSINDKARVMQIMPYVISHVPLHDIKQCTFDLHHQTIMLSTSILLMLT